MEVMQMMQEMLENSAGKAVELIAGVANKIADQEQMTSEVNYTGIWITSFDTFLFPGRTAKEVYFLKQRGNKLTAYIQHYSEGPAKSVSMLKGHGVVRNSKIVMYYVTQRKDSDICGVMYLAPVRTDVEEFILSGNIIEDFSRLDDEAKVQFALKRCQRDLLRLRRVKLKWYKKLMICARMRFGIKAFKNFGEVPE